jgi:hypothetical protein
VLEQLAPEREAVLARCVRYLVDERFDRKCRVRAADDAPPQHRHAGLGGRQIDRMLGMA